MVAHWSACVMQRMAPKTTDIATPIMAVRHVEGNVRSLVHSALSALLIADVRTGEAEGWS